MPTIANTASKPVSADLSDLNNDFDHLIESFAQDTQNALDALLTRHNNW